MKIIKRAQGLDKLKPVYLFAIPMLLFGFIGLRLSLAAGPAVTVTGCQQLVDDFTDNTHSADDILLANDLDCTGYTIAPLFPSATSAAYSGTFDGQNHTISNLTINNGQEAGLIDYTDGATIQNLTLTNVSSSSTSSGAGLVVGMAYSTKFINVHTTGDITGYSYLGGIAGSVFGDTQAVIFQDVSFAGTLTTNSSSPQDVGGIAGYVSANYDFTMDNVDVSSLNVDTTSATGGASNIGGVIGFFTASPTTTDPVISITNVTSVGVNSLAGWVDPTSASISEVGGLIGFLTENGNPTVNISNASVVGPVSGSSYVGGLIGHLYSDAAKNDAISVHDVTVNSAVTAYNGPAGGFIGSLNYIGTGPTARSIYINKVSVQGSVNTNYANSGGFIGSLEQDYSVTVPNQTYISESYSKSNTTIGGSGVSNIGGFIGNVGGSGLTIDKSFAAGNVHVTNGSSAVGGFIGNTNNGVTINQSFATGDVVAEGSSGPFGIAGFIGMNNGPAIINDSYARGDVYATDPSVNPMGAGGFNGQENTSSILTNVYSTGLVASTSAPLFGGLVGNNTPASAVSSYWDTETSQQATSKAGTPKTTAEMKTQATFTGWDFTNTWLIDASVNNGYPCLLFYSGCSTDVDGDGVSNAIENAGPNNGDGNNDGISDSDQSNVTSTISMVGDAYFTVATDEGTTITSTTPTNESDNASQDPDYNYPGGLVETVIDTGGAPSTEVDVYFNGVTNPEGTVVKTYDPVTDTYTELPATDFPITEVTNPDSSTSTVITYTATDGDSNDSNSSTGIINTPVIGLAVADTSGGGTDTSGTGSGSLASKTEVPNTGLKALTSPIIYGLMGVFGIATISGGIFFRKRYAKANL